MYVVELHTCACSSLDASPAGTGIKWPSLMISLLTAFMPARTFLRKQTPKQLSSEGAPNRVVLSVRISLVIKNRVPESKKRGFISYLTWN